MLWKFLLLSPERFILLFFEFIKVARGTLFHCGRGVGLPFGIHTAGLDIFLKLTDAIAPVGVVVKEIGGGGAIGVVGCCFWEKGTDSSFLFCAQNIPGLGFGEVSL